MRSCLVGTLRCIDVISGTGDDDYEVVDFWSIKVCPVFGLLMGVRHPVAGPEVSPNFSGDFVKGVEGGFTTTFASIPSRYQFMYTFYSNQFLNIPQCSPERCVFPTFN